MIKLNARKYLYVIIVIALLISLHGLGILNPVESLISRWFKPIARIFYSAGSSVSQTYGAKTSKPNLAEELIRARADVNRLTAENAQLKFLQDENLILRKQLNFLDKNTAHYLMANIISRGDLTGGAQDSQTVAIDKGLNDGLFPGLPVVSSESFGTSSRGVVIGKIISVKDNLAEACLITNKNCKLAVSILGKNITSGIAHGEMGLTVKMEFIPQTENIKIGDLAATSGLEQYIARGLVVGRVGNVIKENNEVWQSATIEPQINLDNLSIVAVLLP
ncbi:MAG: rod shape-determining protein MreC [bacterium]|nr:rod shape-determining protein MreC [bacterium]